VSDNIEARDYIARAEGWRISHRYCTARAANTVDWFHDKSNTWHAVHPIPNTLDEAAKLPEGWNIDLRRQRNGKWAGEAWDGEGTTFLEQYKDDPRDVLFPLRERVLKHMAALAQETKQ